MSRTAEGIHDSTRCIVMSHEPRALRGSDLNVKKRRFSQPGAYGDIQHPRKGELVQRLFFLRAYYMGYYEESIMSYYLGRNRPSDMRNRLNAIGYKESDSNSKAYG